MTLFRKTFSRKQILRAAIPIAGLALIASVVAGRERPSVPAPVEPARQIDARVRASDDLDLDKLFRAEGDDARPVADPFARKNFGPVQAAEAPAQAPAAPPLPFRYVGKMIEDGKLAVFLSRGEESYTVSQGRKQGQKIDAQYRVDKVSQTQVVFTYLPLKTKQTLDIPSVN